MKLLVVQRRDAIKAMLLEKESVSINEVIDRFGISVETARRDFDALADEGFLNKIYGGATLKNRTAVQPSAELISHTFSDGKRRIANRAARFLKQGDTIFMDSSDTVFHLCEFIMDMDITVLTNSLQVINTLSNSRTVKLIAVGGRFMQTQNAFLGPTARDYMKNFLVDRAFITSKSIDINRGLGSSDDGVADIKKTVIECAAEVCLMVDHSKFSKLSFAKFASLKDIDVLFTDELLTEEWKAALSENGIRYFECPASGDVQKEAIYY